MEKTDTRFHHASGKDTPLLVDTRMATFLPVSYTHLQVDIAELRKQDAYETLKIQIAPLYVQILSNIKTLPRSAENRCV